MKKVPLSLLVLISATSTVARAESPATGGPSPATPATPALPPALQLPVSTFCVTDAITRSVNRSYDEAISVRSINRLPFITRRIGKVLQFSRDRLQRFNGHDYPLTAVKDATAPSAYAMIKQSWGELPTEDTGLIDTNDFKNEVGEMFQKASNYQSDLKALDVDTANLVIEQNAIESLLAGVKKGQRSYRMEIEAPLAQLDPSGKLDLVGGDGQPGGRTFSYGSLVKMQNRLSEIKSEIEHRTGHGYFGSNDIRNRILDQVVTLRRLETIQLMIKDSTNDHPGKPLPQDLQQIYDQIMTLYGVPEDAKSSDALQIKEAYYPPSWAWRNLYVSEVGSEAQSWFYTTLPGLTDKIKQNKIIQFVQKMPQADKDALGLGKISDKVGFWAQTRVGVLATSLASGTGVGTSIYKFFISDLHAKQTCAELGNDAKFRDCRNEYLEKKFGAGGKNYSDPKVKAEIADIMKRRSAYLKNQNAASDRATQADQIAVDVAVSDVKALPAGSPAQKEALLDLQRIAPAQAQTLAQQLHFALPAPIKPKDDSDDSDN